MKDELDADDQAPQDRHSHSLEQVLKKLPGLTNESLNQPGGKAQLESRLLKLFPDLEGTPQLERLVQDAMEFSARGLGLQMAAEMPGAQASPRRRMIFSCPTCDEVFIDEGSLKRHQRTHRDPDPISVLVQAEFELIAPQRVELRKAPRGIRFKRKLSQKPGWEWRLEGRCLLKGGGPPQTAAVELFKLLAQPGLLWLGDALLLKHLTRIEKAHPYLLHHSLWSLGLTLRDLRCLLQRLDQSGWKWTNWLSFLETVPEAVLRCRQQGGLPAGPLSAEHLDRLVTSLLACGSPEKT